VTQEIHDDLKNLFKSAAISASTRPGPLRDFYTARVDSGMRPTMARLTLARKIASITLTMWKKGASFDPNPIRILTLQEMLDDLYGKTKMTVASSEVRRLLQVIKACGWKP